MDIKKLLFKKKKKGEQICITKTKMVIKSLLDDSPH